MWVSKFRFVLGAMFLWISPSVFAQSYEICTDYWPPYVNGPKEELGAISRRVDIILDNAELDHKWRYADFSYCQYKTGKTKDRYATFPWFGSPERLKSYYLSDPVYAATNRIYFNRQFNRFSETKDGLSGYKLGRVAGYYYGERINKQFENAVVFNSEIAALEALLTGEIDLLPLAEDVLKQVLVRHFLNRQELIRPMPGVADTSPLYVMAPRTEIGKQFITKFNTSMKELIKAKVILSNEELAALSKDSRKPAGACKNTSAMGDLAKIVASEGFPVILGHEVTEKTTAQYVAIPQGTNVIVVCWSARIAEPTQSDRLYKTMVDESRVVILDGPHVGKEVLIKNMHLAVAD